jgi:hypothetical protein
MGLINYPLKNKVLQHKLLLFGYLLEVYSFNGLNTYL